MRQSPPTIMYAIPRKSFLPPMTLRVEMRISFVPPYSVTGKSKESVMLVDRY